MFPGFYLPYNNQGAHGKPEKFLHESKKNLLHGGKLKKAALIQ
jgi:hypothetical protein